MTTARVAQTASFLGASGFFVWGGSWQWRRRCEKIDVIEKRHNRLRSNPVACPTSLKTSELENLEYQPIAVRGWIDLSKEKIIGARTAPYPLEGDRENIKTWGGYLYCPMKTQEGTTIIVNRGWAPNDRRQVAEKEQTFPDGTTKFIGVLRKAEPRSWIMPGVDSSAPSWLFLDKEASIKHFGLDLAEDEYPIILDVLSPQSDEDPWPRRKNIQTFANIAVPPEQHAAYVFIWATLAVVALYYAHFRWRVPIPGKATGPGKMAKLQSKMAEKGKKPLSKES